MVYPLPLIDCAWASAAVTDPLAAGPTGPAGLELDDQFDGGWSAGVGGPIGSHVSA